MRGAAIGLLLMSAGSLKVCGSEGSATQAAASASAVSAATASGAAAAAIAPAKARIGGQVAVAGDHSVELVLHRSGAVEGLVSDSKGALVSAGIGLSATVAAKSGTETIALDFSKEHARFEGHAKAGVALAPAPVQIALSVNGQTSRANLGLTALASEPEFGGTVVVAGNHSAEVVMRPNGELLAFVHDASGARVSGAAGLQLAATVSAAAGARETLQLAFDAPQQCFVGRLRSGVNVVPGPLELSIKAQAGMALGRLEQLALRADAAHGGHVIVAGDYSVELVPSGKELAAFVFDASGKAVTAADLGLHVNVGIPSAPSLALRWDPASASYRADLAAGLDIDTHPLTVLVSAGERVYVGGAASLRAIADAHLDPVRIGADAAVGSSAKVGADAKLVAGANVKVPDVKGQFAKAEKGLASAAQIKVSPPKLNVSKSASASANAGTKTGASAKASAGFSFGVK